MSRTFNFNIEKSNCMHAKFDQYKRNVRTLIIFYVNVIQRHFGISLPERSTRLTLTTNNNFNEGIPKEVVAQRSGFSGKRFNRQFKKTSRKPIKAA